GSQGNPSRIQSLSHTLISLSLETPTATLSHPLPQTLSQPIYSLHATTITLPIIVSPPAPPPFKEHCRFAVHRPLRVFTLHRRRNRSFILFKAHRCLVTA
ncbi:hypothetical protein PIB30_081570, partial [Stylosanthes scabra]|nr:hypothetical protein [Stylosanthes scabra]